MSWWRIRFLVPGQFADAVAWLLAAELDHPAEVQDGSTMSKNEDGAHAAIVLAFGREPDDAALKRSIERALQTFGIPTPALQTQRSEDESWREGWRAFFKSTALSDRVAVRPPWEDGIDAEVSVVIDPGMAFGTGTHPTTRGCMKVLDRLLGCNPPTRILDVGCGSAILAIAAAHLGHEVMGVDIDGDAIRSAQGNVELNGVEARVTLLEGTAATVDGTFPLVVANILAPILIENAHEITARCAGDLILSGLMAKHEAGVLNAYGAFELVSRTEEGEWIVLHLRLT